VALAVDPSLVLLPEFRPRIDRSGRRRTPDSMQNEAGRAASASLQKLRALAAVEKAKRSIYYSYTRSDVWLLLIASL
jgi:hypothetical protein